MADLYWILLDEMFVSKSGQELNLQLPAAKCLQSGIIKENAFTK